MELDAHPLKEYLLVYWPFAIYAAWISMVLIANLAAYLSKINWNGWGLSEGFRFIAIVAVAVLVNIIMIVTRTC